MSAYVPSDSGATSGSTTGPNNNAIQHSTPPNNNTPTPASNSALTSQNLSSNQQADSTSTRTLSYVADHITSRSQYKHQSSKASIDANIRRQKALIEAIDALVKK